MDVEIGLKMRSAIKAKLTELGCYVDDELPDYVMVMVSNKRTRSQMEEDLQLFLGDNTELFVNWLHQVLKKLHEVQVSAPSKAELEKTKSEKKEKSKKDSKKAKKKEKEKKAKKKSERKSQKSKRKSKHEQHDIIRPNIPPLLMNMEKPEPSITDAFAGQILKNHGVTVEAYNEDTTKPNVIAPNDAEIKRFIVPIIDPATIPSQSVESENKDDITPIPEAKDDHQIKELNEIESKIHGLKRKLAERTDILSDDDDFLNIRTESEELMNDFAEDVFQENCQHPPATPPIYTPPTPVQTLVVQPQKPKATPFEPETLPQIELNLPKRPIRERLGAREIAKLEEKEEGGAKTIESPERLTPEREPERPQTKSAKSRLGSQTDSQRKTSEASQETESTKRLASKVLARTRSACTSVVRVRPRPRVGAPASSLLLRAVADAHKSLLNIPPKVEPEPQTIQRALVRPMRRGVDPAKIVIQVPGGPLADSRADNLADGMNIGDTDNGSERTSKVPSDVTAPRNITKVITNTEYVPKSSFPKDDIDTINIHNTTVDKNKDTQFIVTMDGYHPNSFLAKKLQTEGILDEEVTPPKTRKLSTEGDNKKKSDATKAVVPQKDKIDSEAIGTQKRLSDTSEDSATQVIINQGKPMSAEKKTDGDLNQEDQKMEENAIITPVKKRRVPIVFDVDMKAKEKKGRERERTLSASSDAHVVLTTPPNPHKYDTIPPLLQAERKLWCRSFPLCRFGAACAFAHPRCKFGSSCTRRACPYSHAPAGSPAGLSAALAAIVPTSAPAPAPVTAPASAPIIASHVVPAANYKSISGAVSNLCKYNPACANPTCHYYHQKVCRYGDACANKLECNFFHNNVPVPQYPG